MRAGVAILAVMASHMPAFAQNARPGDPPPAGWSVGLGFGIGWNSNPLELTGRAKGDIFLAPEITLGYRLPLWSGAALSANVTANPELYAREHGTGVQRGNAGLSLSQRWSGTTFSLLVSARKAMAHDFSRHDSASQEIAFGVFRTFILAENWSLSLNGRIARRAVDDGTKDQFRAGLNATLAYRSGAWIWRAGAGFGYTLEDKTPILPRINDRTISARMGVGYEWAKDRELALGGSFSRTYSSYQPNRTKTYTIQPRVSATIRF